MVFQRMGFTQLPDLHQILVGSYPTFSPLLPAEAGSGIFSAALSVRTDFRRLVPRFRKARHPVVSGLSSRPSSKRKPRDHPGSGRSR